MPTTRLPAAQIQAEAYFAAEAIIPGQYTLGTFVSELPELALLPAAPESFTRHHPEPTLADLEGQETIDRSAYMRQLNELRGDTLLRGAVQVAARGLVRYADFKPAIEDLFTQLDKDWTSVPLLGEGQKARVYPLAQDGKQYALHDFRGKLLEGYDVMQDIFDIPGWYGGPAKYRSVLAASKGVSLALGYGLEGAAQLTTFSPADGLCISPRIPGKRFADITVDDIPKITSEHIAGFIATLKALQARHLIIDPNVDNFYLWNGEDKRIFTLDYQRGDMSNEQASAGLETLAKGIVARPESHGEDQIVGDPQKIKAGRYLLEALQTAARKEFGTSLPVTVKDLIASRAERPDW